MPESLDKTFIDVSSWMTPESIGAPGKLDSDKHKKIHTALSSGAIIGYHLNLTAYSPMTILSQDIVKAIPIYVDNSVEDKLEKRSLRGQYLVEAGMRAMDGMGDEVNSWVERYEERLVDDVTMQRFVRVGCGIITLSARRAFDTALKEHHTHELAVFESEITGVHDVDWDKFDWTTPSKND